MAGEQVGATIESLTEENKRLKEVVESLTKEKEELLAYKDKCCVAEIEGVLSKFNMQITPSPGIQLSRKT